MHRSPPHSIVVPDRWQDRRLEVYRHPASSTGAPELLFLHEALGSVGLWRGYPQRLATELGAGWSAYSRPGHGRSQGPAGPRPLDYLDHESRRVLPEVLAELGLTEPVLYGHSDGATIALIYAAAATESLTTATPLPQPRALVLEAPHVFVEDVTTAGIRRTVATWQNTDLPLRLGRHHDDAADVFAAWHGIWLNPEFRSWNIEALLPSVRCPVLIVQGENDEYGTMAQVEAIVRHVTGEIVVGLLPDCGHAPHRERPDEVRSLVCRFLRTVLSSAFGSK
ncbi:Alpha/beta hydrolase [uncultured Gammaproteobacteria bacterium]